MRETRRPISSEERTELIEAIKSGEIKNASEHARVFAAKHDLNPQTVRAAISRLRRELGLLERPPADWPSRRTLEIRGRPTGAANPATGWQPDAQEIDRTNAFTLLGPDEITDARLTRLSAAAVVRYEEDEHFRQTVDQERPAIEGLYRRLSELREVAEDLSREELEELVRFVAGRAAD